MIDTHTHLYLQDAFPEQEGCDAVHRAIEAGVTRMIMPNVDTSSIASITAMRDKFPDNVFMAMGLHPTEVTDSWKHDLAIIEKHLDSVGMVGLGEIGMDLYWDASKRDHQIKAFKHQLEWAVERRLPVIIHQRKALQDTLDILKETDLEAIPAIIFHCFTEGVDSVRAIREIVPDAFFGIGGVVTFKNASDMKQAIPEIGIQRIVLETDAPWLAPVPHRGKRNESSYIPVIAGSIAEILGIPPTQVESTTTDNANQIFNLPVL